MQDKITAYGVIGNKSSKCEEKFRHQDRVATNKITFMKKIKSSINSGNSCYHLVQNLLPSSLLSKNKKD